jgi:hypothetical protein
VDSEASIMKKALLFAGLLLALTASVAMAAGVSVSWKNFCWGEDGSSNLLTWACNTNSNVNIRMTCSFKTPAGAPDFNGVGVFMEGMTAAAVVPDWWKLGAVETGDCRANLITLSADGSVLANAGADICFDPWQGLGAGGIGLYSWDGNQMHVNAAYAVADGVELLPEVEYFAVQFRVAATKTVNACTGCLIPAIWGLKKIDWTTPASVNTLDEAYAGGNQCLWWQDLSLACQKPVPARNTTWGQVKSLYR